MEHIFAVEYEILRDVPVSGRDSTGVERKPVRIGTLIDEAKFLATGGAMVHNQTVFFEDQHHDWSWKNGKFRYYTRVAEGKADVVVAYAVEKRERTPEIAAALQGAAPGLAPGLAPG